MLIKKNSVSTSKCLVFGTRGRFCLEASSCNMETRLEHKTTCFHRNDYIEYIKTYQLYLVDCPESSKLINDR